MKDVSDWSDDDLEWGLVGCAHDMDHVLEKIIDAENIKEALSAIEEYEEVTSTRKSYELEIERRKSKGE